MTSINIPPNDRRIEYTGNVQTLYNYDFPIYDQSDIAVELNGTLLTLNTEYSVQDVGEEAGGTVTLVTETVAEDILVLYGAATVERVDQNFQQAGDFFSQTLNRQLNEQVTFIQELKTTVGRQFGLADGSIYAGSLDFPEAEANLLIGWNDAANALENKTATTGEALPATASTYLKRNAGNTAFAPLTVAEVKTDLGIDDIISDLDDKLDSVVGGTNITVDATDPVNPIINQDALYADGYKNGGVISNDGTTPDEIVNITARKARSQDNTEDLSFVGKSLDQTVSGDFAGTPLSLISNRIYTWDEYNGGTNRPILDDETGTGLDDVNKSERIGYYDTDSNGDIIAGSQVQDLPEPFETALYRGGDILFTGNAGVSTINLNQDVNDYKFLEVTAVLSGGQYFVHTMTVDTYKSLSKIIMPASDSATNFIMNYKYDTNTTLEITQALSMALTQVVGIK